MKNTANTPQKATISFVDPQGRTITMPAPPPGVRVMKVPPPPDETTIEAASPIKAKTVQDTNLSMTMVDKEGKEQEVAITLRDDSVQEIFERMPSLLTRFGSAMVLGILLAVLAVMAFVQYPDTVNAAAMIRQAAGTTETASNLSRLEKMLNNVQQHSESITIPLPEQPLILGALQLPYQELLLAYEAYQENKSRSELVATMRALAKLESAFLSWKKSQGPAIFDKGTHFATLELPIAKTAGLAVGQHVSLDLSKYSVGQYGRLVGKVADIQQPATPGEPYRVNIALPEGLTTTTQVIIPYEEGLSATAAIVTNQQSLLRKVLD